MFFFLFYSNSWENDKKPNKNLEKTFAFSFWQLYEALSFWLSLFILKNVGFCLLAGISNFASE